MGSSISGNCTWVRIHADGCDPECNCRAEARPTPVGLKPDLRIFVLGDEVFALAGGRMHAVPGVLMKEDLVVEALSVDGARDRGIHADQPLRHVELVGPDDAVAQRLAVLVLQRDPGAEVHLAVVRGRLAHDLHLVEAPGEVAHAAVDRAQAALAVDVVAVLRAVAVLGGLVHRGRDLRALDLPQLHQLLAQALLALRSDMGRLPRAARARAEHSIPPGGVAAPHGRHLVDCTLSTKLPH